MTTKPLWRTISQCYKEIKKIDPDSAISLWFIRCLCNENKVEHFKSGTKFYVNMNNLFCYLGFEVIILNNFKEAENNAL